MRAYIAHNMDGNEEFLPCMEMARSKVAATRKLAEKGAYLLRKVDEENKASQVKACRLAEEKVVIAAEKEKAKEETGRIRWELQDLRVGFATQKKELEDDYRK